MLYLAENCYIMPFGQEFSDLAEVWEVFSINHLQSTLEYGHGQL